METPKSLPEVIQYIAKEQQQKAATQLAEAQTKLLAAAYDKAATYTTVIVFGGYAGFFGLWQLAKDHLTKEQALWSALLVLISLLAFVLFEVLKMVLVTRSMMKKAVLLKDPQVRSSPLRLTAALQELEQAQTLGVGPLMIAWAITVGIALIGALGGAGVLGYAFIVGLAA